MKRDSILFYYSFYEAAQQLGQKARLRLYDSILEVSFSDYESIEELEKFCNEVASKLKDSRMLFAHFSLIKPHLINSGKLSLNGRKGGGQLKNTNAKKRPKNEQEEKEIGREREREREREMEREMEKSEWIS